MRSAIIYLALFVCSVAQPSWAGESASFKITSAVFKNNGAIPKQYTCLSMGISPRLSWTGTPEGAQSFALIADDPDAPGGTFVHWVTYNIPPTSNGLPQGIGKDPALPGGGSQGLNGSGAVGYTPPCPPPGKPHHYHFHLYALDSQVTAGSPLDAAALKAAMKGHIKASTEVVGTFAR